MVVTISLTKGKSAIVDDEDGDLATLKWQAKPGKHTCYTTHHTRQPNRVQLRLHRVILSRMLGRELEQGELVDHINSDGLDNRRCNLRLATQAQNMQNRRMSKYNSSGYKGVHWRADCQKWCARISVDSKRVHLGMYDTPEEAHEAYKQASAKYYGEYARLK